MEPNETCYGKHRTTDERCQQEEAKEVQVPAADTIVQEGAMMVEASNAVVAKATVAGLWWLLEHSASIF